MGSRWAQVENSSSERKKTRGRERVRARAVLAFLSRSIVFWWDIAGLPNTRLIIPLIIHSGPVNFFIPPLTEIYAIVYMCIFIAIPPLRFLLSFDFTSTPFFALSLPLYFATQRRALALSPLSISFFRPAHRQLTVIFPFNEKRAEPSTSRD